MMIDEPQPPKGGARRTPRARNEFFAGMRDELPILAGVIPFGLIYGITALGAGLSRAAAQAMSAIVFAGSAQFVAAQFIGVGVPGIIIVVTIVIINLRHALYSASLAPYTQDLAPRWKLLLAYLLTDEAFAVAITHYYRPGNIRLKHWYFLGAGLALWSAWQVSTAVGIFLGAHVPASWSLDFALPLTFIALIVPVLKDRAGLTAALTAGIAAVILVALPFKSGLLAATFIGITLGLWAEARPKAPLAEGKETEV